MRPVLERIDRIGYAEIDQQLRADDRARASRAVDHDRGRRVGHDVPDAQRELAVRTADPARDVHLVEFGERAAVDDHEIFPRLPHGLERLRGDARGVTLMLDQLAESLARHIDAGIERVAGLPPGIGTAFQHMRLGIAELLGARRRAGRDAAAVVAEHQPHGRVRHQGGQAELEAAVGQRDREEQMPHAVLAVLARVENGDLGTVREPGLQSRSVDVGSHGSFRGDE